MGDYDLLQRPYLRAFRHGLLIISLKPDKKINKNINFMLHKHFIHGILVFVVASTRLKRKKV